MCLCTEIRKCVRFRKNCTGRGSGGVGVDSALPLCKLPVSTAKPLQGRNKRDRARYMKQNHGSVFSSWTEQFQTFILMFFQGRGGEGS